MQYLQKQNNTDKDLLEYQSLLKELESRNIFKLPSEGPITFKERLIRSYLALENKSGIEPLTRPQEV